MSCPIEQPTPIPPTIGEGEAYSHPAYAVVQVTRRTGGEIHLYGSDACHNEVVAITVCRSELHRTLHEDRYAVREELLELEMTEMQFTELMGSVGQYGGVPATIRHLEGREMPGLPPPPDRIAQFASEVQRTLDNATGLIREMADKIEALPLSKAKKKELMRDVTVAHQNLASNIGFIAEQFDEHLARSVEQAKHSLASYAARIGDASEPTAKRITRTRRTLNGPDKGRKDSED